MHDARWLVPGPFGQVFSRVKRKRVWHDASASFSEPTLGRVRRWQCGRHLNVETPGAPLPRDDGQQFSLPTPPRQRQAEKSRSVSKAGSSGSAKHEKPKYNGSRPAFNGRLSPGTVRLQAMADVDHIRLLCRGVAVWNKARANAAFDPDLSHLEIRDAALRGADFRSVEFDGARLFNVDAQDALFREARLNGLRAHLATFARSDLASVEFKGADFTRSSFNHADLSGAVTFDLKVRHCDLRDARLAGAALEGAHFYNSDLAGAAFDHADLESATFKRVRIDAEIADRLIGAGARMALLNQVREDEWIDWERYGVGGHGELFGRILYRNQVYWISEGRWDFFISHASTDKDDVARPLADALRDLGQRVWYDEFTIRLGDDLSRVIEYGTQSSLFGVFVISKAFFGRRWTEAEVGALQDKRIFVVLHGVDVEELAAFRPELANRLTISTDVGPARIAEALIASIRTPRPEDHM